MSWLIKMIQWWQSLCWSVDGFCVWLWLWAWQGPVLTVSWCLWYRGNQAVMGSPRPWDPDTIHRAGSSSKSHYITNNLIPTYIKLYLWQNTIKCFTLLQDPYESTILSYFVLSAFKTCTQVVRIWIRASSTMVGIQAMTRSISQFLNRHSQSLSPATARPSHALQRHSHRRYLYR